MTIQFSQMSSSSAAVVVVQQVDSVDEAVDLMVGAGQAMAVD
jgi:hypothetical protein